MIRLILTALAACLVMSYRALRIQTTKSRLAVMYSTWPEPFKTTDSKSGMATSSGKSRRIIPEVVAVNLYSGNAYWFTASTGQKVEKLKVSVFDDTGKPVSYLPYQSGTRAAAGFSPDASGLYYVKVALEEGQPATFCLIYSYK